MLTVDMEGLELINWSFLLLTLMAKKFLLALENLSKQNIYIITGMFSGLDACVI